MLAGFGLCSPLAQSASARASRISRGGGSTLPFTFFLNINLCMLSSLALPPAQATFQEACRIVHALMFVLPFSFLQEQESHTYYCKPEFNRVQYSCQLVSPNSSTLPKSPPHFFTSGVFLHEVVFALVLTVQE